MARTLNVGFIGVGSRTTKLVAVIESIETGRPVDLDASRWAL